MSTLLKSQNADFSIGKIATAWLYNIYYNFYIIKVIIKTFII